MSGVTVPVAAGRSSTQLTGAPLAKGTTIYNADSANSVWVSSAQSVSPGNGQLVGPLGTAEWNSDSNAFACVDTGVIRSVSVIISGDVSSVTNPVAIGAAVAARLLLSGIPLTYTNQVVGVSLPSGTAQYTVPVDLSPYAGLSILLFQCGPPQLITLSWLDGVGGSVITQHTYLATGQVPSDTGTSANLQIRIPVESATLRIDFSRGSSTGIIPTNVRVYASSRLQTEAIGNTDLGVDYTSTQTWASGAFYMGSITTNGGLHAARMNVNGTGKAYFGYQTCNAAGVVKNIYQYLSTTAGLDFYGQIILPRGCIALYVLPNVLATYTAEFSVTPEQ